MNWRILILTLCILAAGLACLLSPEIKSGTDSGVIMSWPVTLAGFVSETGEPDPVELKLLPDDTEFAKRTYFSPTDYAERRDQVSCSIVLSGDQRRSIHRPEVCLVGQGWTVISSVIRPVELSDGRSLKVTDLFLEKPITVQNGERKPIRAHYVYWFVGTDVTTPSHTERIWLTMRDNLFRGINHRWAYASVMAVVTEGFAPEQTGQRVRTDEETIELVNRIIRGSVPQLQKEFMQQG